MCKMMSYFKHKDKCKDSTLTPFEVLPGYLQPLQSHSPGSLGEGPLSSLITAPVRYLCTNTGVHPQTGNGLQLHVGLPDRNCDR